MALDPVLTTRLLRLQPSIAVVSAEAAPRVLDPARLVAVAPADLPALGITLIGNPSNRVLVTDPGKTVGIIRIEASGNNALIVIDTDHRGGRINGNIRIGGHDCTCILSTPDYGVVSLNIVAFRSAEQSFYWGRGATAVGISVEIEGRGRSVLVGDDALISSGVWIRNHDMHAIVDLTTGAVANPDPVDTLIEPHVWIGQDVLLLNCSRVGYGSILAAKALVRGTTPPISIVGGVPGRVIRSEASWGRDLNGLSERERDLLGQLAQRAAATTPIG